MKKFLMLFLISALMVPELRVFANSISNMQQQQREIRGNVEVAREDLQATQSGIEEIKNEIMELDLVLDEATENLITIQTALADTELELENTELALEQARLELDEHTERFKTRLRVMYIHGPTGYLDVVLQATSFTDFLTRLDHMNTIALSDREMATILRESEDAVAEKLEETFRQKNRITALEIAQEDTVRELERALAQKEDFLGQLEEGSDQLEAVIQKLEQDERDITQQIQRAQAAAEAERRRREAEEAVRRAAEEAARRSAAAPEGSAVQSTSSVPQGGRMTWPLPGHTRVSSPYGNRTHPITRRAEFHTGIDLPAASGTVIVAAAEGTVILSGWNGGFGNTVVIDHGGGLSTLYAHNSRNLVSVGEKVTAGMPIARVGSTGVSTGPHLHFEVRQNGRHVNPNSYLGL